jgi:hypothetical protein
MRNMVTAATLILALAAAGTAKGDDGGALVMSFFTGNSILALCQGANPEFCMGYVTGIADALSNGPVGDWRACCPANVANGQVRDIAVRYLVAHPETRHLVAGSLVAHALAEAFPCK